MSRPPAERLAGPRVDLRLVPAAVTAWVAALAVVRLAAGVALLAGLVALAAAALAALVARVDERRERRDRRDTGVRRERQERQDGDEEPRRRGGTPRAGGRSWPGAAVLVLLVAAAVLLAGAVQQHARTAGLLGAALADGRAVLLAGRVSAQPTVTGGYGGATMRVAVQVREVSGGGVTERAAAPVLVLAPVGDLSAGAWISVRGVLVAGSPGERPVALLRSSDPVVTLREPSGPAGWAAHVRRAADRVTAALPGDAGALLPAIAWGSTGRVDDALADRMRTAGLSHVVAVSGAHFAIVTGLVLGAVGRWSWPRWARVVLVATVGAALVLLVGPQPSVLRAAVMGGVGALGLWAGRGARGPAALCAAVVVLLVADPWLAAEAGFALSVLATASLVGLGPLLMERWAGRLGRIAAGALAAPVAAQLATAPISATLSGGVALWALPANLLVAPVIAPVTVLGLSCALVAPLWPAAAHVLAVGAAAGCWWVATVAGWAARAPLATVTWLPGAVGTALLALGAVSCGALLAVRPPSAARCREDDE